MDNIVLQPVFFIILLLILFFLSCQTTNEIFYFLRMFIKNDSTVFGLVTFFFLPGTILHEFSHFFMAIILFLPVHKIQILPEFEKNYIKLGKVLYEKKDVIRGVIVGIAPLLGAMLFFWFLSIFHLFPQQNIWLSILLGYVVFSVSTSMFSSKQDLIDLVYIIPFIALFWAIIYLFNINLSFIIQNRTFIRNIQEFFYNVRFYLVFSLIIHGIVIIVLKSLRTLINR
ncbi:hypothetical protein COY87_03810 [Candidatus Roizmanbacteria bacterium CG_4_10_14_0_8_um_filter_33_9]|uniref:Uncharacterized protein n=1 Tax=Candidatus Roizmanbacteria bacterium CG_4_10_14_0_8_um_filter_33_9 TaxID=1974826 RepID=A0A2M7QIW6_9BACT|nr:MAG: hypothetical protein COY87_03810 [Candidatus Roizmanbacteria bacterium CG_4_10_14_0_8_um_filter_33_9]